jgi:predicted ATPase with chaperone activity
MRPRRRRLSALIVCDPLNVICPGRTVEDGCGLPETEVKEARDRVCAALRKAQLNFPPRKIAVKSLYNSLQ